MGGMLARPQDHWPRLFTNPFWGKYPYFLPCVVSASLLLLAFFTLLRFFEEVSPKYYLPQRRVVYVWQSLSTKRRPRLASTMPGISRGANSGDQEASMAKSTANALLWSLLTPVIVIPNANYAMLSFLDVSFRALIPLFLSTPIHLGGMGLTPSSIGLWLAFCGIVDGLFQALFLAKIVDWVGPKRVFCISASCFAPLMVLFPIMSWLVRTRGVVDHAIMYALFFQLMLTVTWDMAFGTCCNKTCRAITSHLCKYSYCFDVCHSFCPCEECPWHCQWSIPKFRIGGSCPWARPNHIALRIFKAAQYFQWKCSICLLNHTFRCTELAGLATAR